MSALPATAYLQHARQRVAEAQRVVDAHTTCAYTGVCRACGRPGPCPDQFAARLDLAHAAASTAAPAATTTAVRLAAGTVDELRDACRTTERAVDRAGDLLDGVAHPLPVLARSRWDAALLDAWHALRLVRAGLAEARRLDGADPTSVDDVLDGLRTARHDAEQAATSLGRLRRRLATAEDRLRHGDASPRARAAAGRWRAAIVRLDLAAARLAVGIGALDRYAARLTSDTDEAAGRTGDGGRLTAAAGGDEFVRPLDRLLRPVRPPATEIAEATEVAAGRVPPASSCSPAIRGAAGGVSSPGCGGNGRSAGRIARQPGIWGEAAGPAGGGPTRSSGGGPTRSSGGGPA